MSLLKSKSDNKYNLIKKLISILCWNYLYFVIFITLPILVLFAWVDLIYKPVSSLAGSISYFVSILCVIILFAIFIHGIFISKVVS